MSEFLAFSRKGKYDKTLSFDGDFSLPLRTLTKFGSSQYSQTATQLTTLPIFDLFQLRTAGLNRSETSDNETFISDEMDVKYSLKTHPALAQSIVRPQTIRFYLNVDLNRNIGSKTCYTIVFHEKRISCCCRVLTAGICFQLRNLK